jgi:hypothetical protein
VIDAALLTDRTALEQIRAQDGSQAEWRVAQNLPFGLMIADGRLALLSLDHHSAAGTALLVRPSPLLDEFNAMFDMMWRRAAPADFGTEPAAKDGDLPAAFSSELEELIPLLAAGFNDKAIAHQLHISARTLMRRIAKLLASLDARSRFQAGWSLALRLHGITASDGAHAALSLREGGRSVGNGRAHHAAPLRATRPAADRTRTHLE